MSYTGMAEANRRRYNQANRRYCEKCRELVSGDTFDAHAQTCQGLFKYFCPHCRRWMTLSKAAIEREMRRHTGYVDEPTLQRLWPVQKKKPAGAADTPDR